MEFLAKVLKKLINLINFELNLQSCGLNDNGTKFLSDALKDLKLLSTVKINLHYNTLAPISA